MLKRSCLTLLAIGLVSTVVVSGSEIADTAPDPVKAVRSIAKDFIKLAAKVGYSTQLTIAGGMAKSNDHQIVDQAVSEDYSGLVRGPLMHMPEAQIFRTTDKGALFDGEIWRVLQSTADGKKLDRLFTFPERLLAEAAQRPQKVEWLDSEDQKPKPETSDEPRGKTGVADRESDRDYNKLRVTLSDKTALQYFIEVQNSGCLSGG
ncbi:MAG: hypothetical protein AAEJ04_11835 [Planctomycetota bacterium]